MALDTTINPTKTSSAARAARLGDVDDVAHLLKVSPKTIRREVDRGKLPGVIRIGRLVRFDLDVLNIWLDQGAPPTTRFDGKGRR